MTETLIHEGSYDIADVAARTALTTHTLRYYERAGLVQAPLRDGTGRRRCPDADIGWLEAHREAVLHRLEHARRDLEHIALKIDLYRKAPS